MSRDSAGASGSGSSFSLGRLLAVVIPLGIVVGGGIYGWGYFDIPARLQMLGRPSLAKGSGQVMFAGKPLGRGILETQHENPDIPGAYGYMDDEGRFFLQTDIEGELIQGAYPGKHKVIIHKMDPTSRPGMMGGAPNMTPPEFGKFETSPLELVVDKDSEKNKYEFTLPGEPIYANPAMLNPQALAQAVREVDPQMVTGMVDRILDQNDKNKDGKLAGEEVEGVQAMFRQAMLAHDENKDGELERAEMEAAAKKFLASMPGGFGAGAPAPPGGGGGGRGPGGGRGKPQRPAGETAEDTKPDAKPTEGEAATEKPATEKPATEKPATEKPATEKPAEESTKEPAPEGTEKPADAPQA